VACEPRDALDVGAAAVTEAEQRPFVDIFGVPVAALTMEQVLATAERAIGQRSRLLIGVVNAAKLVRMRRDGALRAAVVGADLVVADGMSVVWAMRLLRQPLPERIAGIDLMTRLLERAGRHGYRVFCLGATDDVLAQLVHRVAQAYPNAVIVGQQNGYFPADREEQIAETIKLSHADILFAALGTPKQERFLARWAPHLGVPICHGVGGAFDVLAGRVQRAPVLWQRWGCEWLYRLLQEPRRLGRRYVIALPLFTWMVLRVLLTGTGHPHRRSSPEQPE